MKGGDSHHISSEEDREKLLREARRKLLSHFRKLGFLVDSNGEVRLKRELTKDEIRRLHFCKRRELLQRSRKFLRSHASRLVKFIASGNEVVPEEISPKVVPITDPESLESKLFRFATLSWSVPVSQGFGRRLRCLVMDESNGKLMGIFGLCDPVFNLRVRDEWIGWTAQDRRERLKYVVDAFVVGAVPPYSFLKGSKLVAAMIPSREVVEMFKKRYSRRVSVIRQRVHDGDLALITTSSALGRSSLYSRVKVNGHLLYHRLGMNSGYGHFHLSEEVFSLMRELLRINNHPYCNGYRYGQGPNWKMRVIKAALRYMGFSPEVLRHGVRREVYAAPLAENFREFLRGEEKVLRYSMMSLSDITNYALERWILKRARWDRRYENYKSEDFIKELEAAGGFRIVTSDNKSEDN